MKTEVAVEEEVVAVGRAAAVMEEEERPPPLPTSTCGRRYKSPVSLRLNRPGVLGELRRILSLGRCVVLDGETPLANTACV